MPKVATHRFFIVLTLVLSIALGMSVSAFGQGKGKGHRGNRGGGPPPGSGGGGQTFNPGRQHQQQPRFERPQAQQRHQQQPRYVPPPVQRSRPHFDPGQNRGWQMQPRMRVERPRRQQERRPELVRSEPRQQLRMERRADVIRVQPQFRSERGNGRWNREQRSSRLGLIPQSPARRATPGSRAWPNNYGYERSTVVHVRNADRKALKEQEKLWRNRARSEGRRFDARAYRQALYERESRRDNFLRSVIVNVLVDDTDSYSYTPQYDSYYGTPYSPDYYYNTGYGNAYPQYQSSYSDYYPGFYQPDNYYSSYYEDDPYYADGFGDDLPFYYLSNSYGGSSYLREMISKLLAYGYESGYRDGLYARSLSRRNRHYNDPFAYENASYDPYSFGSYSLGENRQCLSEGYELGYQDALYDRAEYDPDTEEADIDLVSLLIGSILQV